MKNDMAASALPAMVTLRQPYLLASALTRGPIRVRKIGQKLFHSFENL